jgi:hypothetical protein
MKSKASEASKEILVFGSNLAGRHGRGAAWFAKLNYGAIYGQGEGLQGRSYAIPTKDARLAVLPLEAIKRRVDRFIKYAERNPDVVFNVTAIGTGLTGYQHQDIAPMFMFAPLNCKLPRRWESLLPAVDGRVFWNG